MSVFAHVDGLGAVVELFTADAVLAWRREFKPGHKTVDTIAEHLTSVDTTVSLRPAGVAIISVHIHPRTGRDEMQHFARAQRNMLGDWNITATSMGS